MKSLKLQVWRYIKYVGIKEMLQGIFVSVFFAYFFYRSVWAVFVTIPIGIFFVWWNLKIKKRREEQYFLEQFKECILSVAASLRAGYAVENAFLESMEDMKMMFGEDSEIMKELYLLQKGLRNNETLESILQALARRRAGEDISEFAEVFTIAKRNSGNVSNTITIYSNMIAQKLDTAQEIQTLLAAKRLEQRVMNIMPFLIILYLEYSNPGYFDMMFHNWTGILIMTGCMAVYLLAFFLAERIFISALG